jgi:adenylate cyclase
MGTMFLQLVDASIVLADLRNFLPLAAQLGPVELGLALSRFYEHAGAAVEKHHGRIVKFIGDGVLSVFVGPHAENRARALAAVAELLRSRQSFLDENVRSKLPVLDYSLGVASGTVQAGELGTEKLHFYDVLGQPVNHAFRLTALAARRDVTNLIDSSTLDGVAPAERPPVIETDAVELDNQKLRLFKIQA